MRPTVRPAAGRRRLEGQSRPAPGRGRGREAIGVRQRPARAVTVTTAQRSHSEDIALRTRRYILTQLVRVVCIALAALLPVALPFRLLFIAGAVILPWLGVVSANAGPVVDRKRSANLIDRVELTEAEPVRRSIEPGRVIDAER